MKEINAQIIINSSPEKVWSILTNFSRYPEWNPFIKSLTGDVKEGSRIQVNIAPPGSKGMTFRPIVLKFIVNKEIRWIGQLFFKGLFDGEHSLELKDNGNDTVTFIQSERFTGILSNVFSTDKTMAGFEMMNQKLKELAEAKK